MRFNNCLDDSAANGRARWLLRWIFLAVFIPPTSVLSQEISPQNETAGDAEKDDAIIFILDCSHSMQEAMSAANPGQQRPRLEVATRQVLSVLTELASKNSEGAHAQVGMRLFGHRAGWNRDSPRRILLQRQYLERFPTTKAKDPTPSTDVETIKRIGKLGDSEAEAVRQRLQVVQPWGESPLYLALKDSLEEFEEHTGNLRKSIIVVTDGANYQSQLEPKTTRSDVLNAWQKDNDVKFYILALDDGPNNAERTDADLKLLANSTGGTYIGVSSEIVLRTRLRMLLKFKNN